MILFGQKDFESSQVSNATQDKERKIIIKSFASNSQRSEKSMPQVRHWAKLKKKFQSKLKYPRLNNEFWRQYKEYWPIYN